jgi:hypothetical protein
MGRTACTEPQCLYKSALYLTKLGTRLRLVRGYETFKETDFTRVFLFVIYDVHVKNVSSLIKLCLCFEKIYDFS